MKPKPLPIVDQINIALHPCNRKGAICGVILGAIVPALVYIVSHRLPVHWSQENYGSFALLLFLCLGGCLVSFSSVFKWCMNAFHNDKFKSIGTVIIVEGSMIASGLDPSIYWVGFPCLAILMFINAISGACSIASESKAYKKELKKK